MWTYNYSRSPCLRHHGIKGMKWGIRKDRKKNGLSVADKAVGKAYAVGAKVRPREFKYGVRKLTNNPNDTNSMLAKYTENFAKENGILPTNGKALRAVSTMGIQRHKDTKYDNIDREDIRRFKKYTDSARYSRGINAYLATGEPKKYADEASDLKKSLSKNKVNDLTVYRSCNYKFSTNGLAKKLDKLPEDELASMFDSFSKNYNGKKLKENRVFSTSTSPLFAIDDWRKVNPTAAKTYNTYLIINCKGVSGVLADGQTTKGQPLVNTRSNQEAILAPTQLQYKKLAYDKERGMFAITVDAM